MNSQAVVASQEEASVQLLLSGVKCAGCVRKVEETLARVPGVTRAVVNFAERTALVGGTAPVASLIAALEAAGYGATPVQDEARALDEKEAAEAAFARARLRDMIFALLVGVPLMLYGVFGGEMVVDTGMSRWGWLVVGLFTLAVLINIAAMTQGEPAVWIGLLALFPLILLLASGLYLFALPYAARWRQS